MHIVSSNVRRCGSTSGMVVMVVVRVLLAPETQLYMLLWSALQLGEFVSHFWIHKVLSGIFVALVFGAAL